MANHSRSSSLRPKTGATVDKRDFDDHRKPPSTNDGVESSGLGGLLRDDESLLSNVVVGVIDRDRRKLQLAITKYASLVSALLCCLCGGSITTFSLYAPLFLSRLGYTQFQVNAVATAGELSQYLSIPLVGLLCDRYSPRPVALISAFSSGGGYILAALAYHHGSPEGGGWPVWVMVIGFLGVGLGTCTIVIGSVTTCGKNFGKSRYRGLAVASPIAALGLSGVWISQVGGRWLTEPGRGGRAGNVDVYRYFLFLSGLAIGVGLVGAVALQVVNEEELIEEAAANQMDRSERLEETPLLRHSTHDRPANDRIVSESRSLIPSDHNEEPMLNASKKTLVLNNEMRRFLTDPAMWLLAVGFFFITGTGESFINNFGTIISTLYPPSTQIPPSNSAATNVSVVAITSTLARLITGYVSDLLAPPTHPSQFEHRAFNVSRLAFLIGSAVLFALFQLLLASSLIQSYPSLFPLVSALAGYGYGTAFTITPIIISVVWGVQSFGTNWGTIAMVPAGGATVWGAIYSAVYQLSVDSGAEMGEVGEGLCYGYACYGATAWGMFASSLVATVLWVLLWRWFTKGGIIV